MKKLSLFILALFIQNCATAQDKIVGGHCEGCEAIYEYGDMHLNAVDTLPDFYMEGPKLKLTGIIYEKDGRTPAENVILYIYHTNQEGIYPTKGDESGWARRHGYIRGWIKTDESGRYTFYTLIPGTYPDNSTPKHIHPVIKEPDINTYWIDEWHFADDPLLPEDAGTTKPHGGSGIVTLKKVKDLYVAKRDIILGINIPYYPNDE